MAFFKLFIILLEIDGRFGNFENEWVQIMLNICTKLNWKMPDLISTFVAKRQYQCI